MRVGVAALGRFDVRPFGACPLFTAWQSDLARQCMGAVSATSRIGRRRQFGDQRHSLRPGQPQHSRRPQRNRQRLAGAAGRHQRASPARQLRGNQFAALAHPRRDAALCWRVTADHRPTLYKIKKGACPPSRTDRDQQVHRHLPGLLGVRLCARTAGDRSLPSRGDQQEQHPIGVIARRRPGLFPSACNDLSVLIVQSPVPASTAPDDDKFQHWSAEHRVFRIIPHRKRFDHRAGRLNLAAALTRGA